MKFKIQNSKFKIGNSSGSFTPLQFYRKMYNLFSTSLDITDTGGNKKVHKNVTGFTLIETLIAVTILSFAITGPMYIAQKSVQASIYSRDEMTASYLAQEAVEYIRFIRDSNKVRINKGVNSDGSLSGTPGVSDLTWLSFLTTNPLTGTSACLGLGGSGSSQCTINATILDYFSSGSVAINTYRPLSTVPYLYTRTDGSYNYYGYNSGVGTWTASKFKRWVRMVETIPNVEATVTVTVGWNPGFFVTGSGQSFARQFTVKEYLYNK